jgi:hypothetical protein
VTSVTSASTLTSGHAEPDSLSYSERAVPCFGDSATFDFFSDPAVGFDSCGHIAFDPEEFAAFEEGLLLASCFEAASTTTPTSGGPSTMPTSGGPTTMPTSGGPMLPSTGGPTPSTSTPGGPGVLRSSSVRATKVTNGSAPLANVNVRGLTTRLEHPSDIEAMFWHVHFAHRGLTYLKSLVTKGIIKLKNKDAFDKKIICETCFSSKAKRTHMPSKARSGTRFAGEGWLFDMFYFDEPTFLSPSPSHTDGFRYGSLAKDQHTSLLVLDLCHRISDGPYKAMEVLEKSKSFHRFNSVFVRSDQAYSRHTAFTKYCKETLVYGKDFRGGRASSLALHLQSLWHQDTAEAGGFRDYQACEQRLFQGKFRMRRLLGWQDYQEQTSF